MLPSFLHRQERGIHCYHELVIRILLLLAKSVRSRGQVNGKVAALYIAHNDMISRGGELIVL